jgi:predicted O-methyltransferase YrrM
MLDRQVVHELQVIANFARMCQVVAGVEGWLRPTEGYALARMASVAHVPGEVVEIGSFKGLSSCWLAMGLMMGKVSGKAFAIDHFRGSPEHQPGQKFVDKDIAASGSTRAIFDATLSSKGLTGHVEAIPMASVEAAEEWRRRGARPIRLVFIDGDHSYEASAQDFALWSEFVTPGGYVAFHDVNAWEGVTRFVGELVAAKGVFKPMFAVDSIRVFQRSMA